MSLKPIRKITVALTIGMMVAACGSVTETSVGTADAATLGAGDALYQASCAECHGTDLRGTDRGPSHLSQVYEPSHHGDFAFELAIKNGTRAHHWNFGDMAPVEGLSDEEIAAITAFVRDVQAREGFEPYPP